MQHRQIGFSFDFRGTLSIQVRCKHFCRTVHSVDLAKGHQAIIENVKVAICGKHVLSQWRVLIVEEPDRGIAALILDNSTCHCFSEPGSLGLGSRTNCRFLLLSHVELALLHELRLRSFAVIHLIL